MSSYNTSININLNADPLLKGFKDFRTANALATRQTLDICAATTRRNALTNIRNDFILRNKFTERSIAYDKVSTNDTSSMVSRAGATKKAGYMALQEFGGVKEKKGKAYAIAQNTARAGSKRNPVSKEFYKRNIKKNRLKGGFKNKGGTSKSRSVASYFAAFKNNKFVSRNSFVMKVNEIHKTRNGRIKMRADRIYYFENDPIIVKANPWLEPAYKPVARDIGDIYHSRLKKLWYSGNVL